MDFKIIAVDFDGALCENKWPEIGAPNKELIVYLKERQAAGDKLVLWTCRVGEILKNAINWSAEQGLIFDAVNENLPEVLEWMGGDTRKVFANEYIDDRNILVSSCLSKSSMRSFADIVADKYVRLGHAYPVFSDELKTAMAQSERAELFGGLVDIVEDWLEEKGITVDDILNTERKDSEDAAIIFGSDYDYLADRFAAILGISRYCTEEASDDKKK